MTWIAKSALNYVIAASAGVAALCVYVWVSLMPGPAAVFGEVVKAHVVLLPIQIVFLGPPTVALLCVAWLLTRRTDRRWLVRPLAFLLTFWVPAILAFFMADLVDGVFAFIAQLLFCCTLPLPTVGGEQPDAPSPSSPVQTDSA